MERKQTPLWVNILSNAGGQFYITLLTLLMVPLALRYLGSEAYGVVGFQAVVLMWTQLLDAGLTPTLSREVARFTVGSVSDASITRFVRMVEVVLLSAGLLLLGIFVIEAETVATSWLQVESLSIHEVKKSLWLIAGTATVRLFSGIHRNCLIGLQRVVSVSAVTCALGTGRFLATWALLVSEWRSLPAFFALQLAFAALESAALLGILYAALPKLRGWSSLSLGDLIALRSTSADMSALTCIWIITSQADRVFLSAYSRLEDFGEFAVALTLAGGIVMAGGAMTQILQPRLIALAAQDQTSDLVRLCRGSLQILVAGAVAASVAFSCYGGKILEAWTGNGRVADMGGLILGLYAAGNAAVVVLSLCFALAFAYGKTRWHVKGTFVFMVFWLPSAFWAARNYGGVGTGWAWFVGNLGFLILWTPLTLRRVLPEVKISTVARDVVVAALPAGLVVAVLSQVPAINHRVVFLLWVAVVAGIGMSVGIVACKESRSALFQSLARILQPANLQSS
jgi:O-antigen/teichoic acid export membrane protein